MPGSDLTDVFVRIWNLWEGGQRREAWQEFTRYLPLIRYELQPGLGVSVMKQNLRAGGVIASDRVRHPTRSLDDIGRREVEALRAELPMRAMTWAAVARRRPEPAGMLSGNEPGELDAHRRRAERQDRSADAAREDVVGAAAARRHHDMTTAWNTSLEHQP